MDKLLEIKGLVNQVQMKKVWFGGYSKEDVQVKMDMMMEIIEKTIAEQNEKEAELLANFETEKEALREELESKKKVSDILVVDLNKNIDELTEVNRAMKVNQEKTEILNEALKTEKYALEQECSKLKDAYNEISSIRYNLEQEQMKLKQAYEALIEENQKMAEDQAKMKDAYRAYCGEILKEYSESLRSLSGEFSRILENVSNMQKEIDEESIFEGLERAFEGREPQTLTGTVE